MALWVILLLVIGNGLRGTALEAHDDLENDVDSLQVQGYEVHEEQSDHSRESSPHLVTTDLRPSSARGQGSTGASESGEQDSSAARTMGVYLKSDEDGKIADHRRADERTHPVTTVLRRSYVRQGQVSKHASESGENDSSVARNMGAYLKSDEDGGIKDHRRADERPHPVTTVLRYSSVRSQESNRASESGEKESSAALTMGAYLTSTGYGELTDHISLEERSHIVPTALQNSSDGRGQDSADASEPGEQKSSAARVMGFYQPADEGGALSHHNRDDELPLYGTLVLRQGSTDHDEESSSSSELGEQSSSADTLGVNRPFGEPMGNYEAGKEIVKITNKSTNVYATPEGSALTDSLKYSVGGDDATFTHKPIIVRSLTLSELDNSNRDHINLSTKRYTNVVELQGGLKHHEEDFPKILPDVSKTQNNINPLRKEYKEIVRRPFHSYESYGSQDESGYVEQSDSLARKIDDGTSALQVSNPPRVLTQHPHPSSFEKDDTLKIGTERKIHGLEEFSRIPKNQEENRFGAIPTYEQSTSSVNHVVKTDTSDGAISFPYQNRHILDQSRYPTGAEGLILNQNRFSYPFVPETLNVETYRLRTPYPIQHQQNLHHIDHSVSSSSEKGKNLNERDQADFGLGILNSDTINNSQYAFFPPRAGNVDFSFGGFPFIRPLPSFSSFPRDGPEIGLSEGFITDFVR